MTVPNEESPLLNDASRSQDNQDLEASSVDKYGSSLPNERSNDPEPPTTSPSDPKADRRTYLVLGMLMLSTPIIPRMIAPLVAVLAVLSGAFWPTQSDGDGDNLFFLGRMAILTLVARSFLIQCPMIVFVATLVIWKLPSPPAEQSPDNRTKSRSKKFSRIDFPGSILLFFTIASLLLVLDLGGKKLPLGSPIIIGLICATVALAISFVLAEAYTTREPVFPLRLAVNRDIATAYGAAALQLAAEFGVTSTVPLYFQVTQNAKVAVAGARLLPGLVAYAFGGLLAGALIAKTGRYKLLGLAGPTISCVGFMLLFTRWRGNTNNAEAFYIIPGDFGSGISQSTAFIALSAAIDKADTAVAMTGYSVCQQLGVTIGASTTAAILQSRLRVLLERHLGKGLDTSLVIKRVISDIGYIKSLTGSIKYAVADAYVGGLSYTYRTVVPALTKMMFWLTVYSVYSFSLAACAVIAAIFVKERKL
ncbi:MAG: hypothetical protein Q9216_001799 [Gyalolechia sp. 2 TL-2023]